MSKWTQEDIPKLSGITVVVTGANSGLGLETTRALASKGAHVLMACRSEDKARAAAAEVRNSHPNASLSLRALDLASFRSIRAFASEIDATFPRIDVLINNAGVMALPPRKTEDGLEMQIGTNHFGHFALTGLLWGALSKASAPRVVTVSSQAHKIGKLRFDDLHYERRRYAAWPAYGASKLANLLFTYELVRRAEARGSNVCAVAAHPGYAATNLQLKGPAMRGERLLEALTRLGNPLLGQSPEMGALPQLYAATAGDVRAGDYIGPDGPLKARGYPEKQRSSASSHDLDAARRLWDVSERTTGVTFPL